MSEQNLIDLIHCANYLGIESLESIYLSVVAHNLQKCNSIDHLREKVLLPEDVMNTGKVDKSKGFDIN